MLANPAQFAFAVSAKRFSLGSYLKPDILRRMNQPLHTTRSLHHAR